MRERSSAVIATITNSETAEKFSRSLTIEKIIAEAIPVSVLKQTVSPSEIKLALDAELTRFVASLNLKWTINDSQIKSIVEDLLYKFPNETLEDFVLVFRKARLGEFINEDGSKTIYRLDSAVIFDWMNKYLEIKYEAIERDLMKQKDTHNFNPRRTDSDWIKLWQESLEVGHAPKTNKQSIAFLNHLKTMTEKEIKEQGQEKPKHLDYPSTPKEYSDMIDLKAQYGRECCDLYTGKVKPGMPTFEEWIELNS